MYTATKAQYGYLTGLLRSSSVPGYLRVSIAGMVKTRTLSLDEASRCIDTLKQYR